MTTAQVSRDSKDYALFTVAGAVMLGVILWGAGAAAALVSGHRVPHGRQLAGFAAFAHFADPSAAWNAPVGPAALYWTVTATVFVAVGGLTWLGWGLITISGPPTRRPRRRTA